MGKEGRKGELVETFFTAGASFIIPHHNCFS